jgi:hypothetical protein
MVWLIEKFILQLFAVQFHKRAYKDRMEESKRAFQALCNLNKARKARKESKAFENSIPDTTFSDTFTDNDSPLSRTGNAVKEIGYIAADGAKTFFSGIGKLFGAAVGIDLGSSAGLILRTPQDAKMFAKRLFQVRQGFLIIRHFPPRTK